VLFHYNTGGSPGGQADFDNFVVDEPRARGLTRPIPYGNYITIEDRSNGNVLAAIDGTVQSVTGADRATAFKVVDRGRGRFALQTKSGAYVSVRGSEVHVSSARLGDAETFQWVDLQRGDTLFLSIATHRYIAAPNTPGPVVADHPGPQPDRQDGSCFKWKVVK
jgi:hypothetical protein